jgi:hypothetical protein
MHTHASASQLHLLVSQMGHCTREGGTHETPVPVGLSALVLPIPVVLALPLHDTPAMRLHVMYAFSWDAFLQHPSDEATHNVRPTGSMEGIAVVEYTSDVVTELTGQARSPK